MESNGLSMAYKIVPFFALFAALHEIERMKIMKQYKYFNTKILISASFPTCIAGLGFSQHILSKYAAVRWAGRLPTIIFLKFLTAAGTQHKIVNIYRREVVNNSFILNVALCLKVTNRLEQVVKNYPSSRRRSFATSPKTAEHYASTGVDRDDSCIQFGDRDESDNPAKIPVLSRIGVSHGLRMHYKTHVSHSLSNDRIQRYGDTANMPKVYTPSQASQGRSGLPVWDTQSIFLPTTSADIRRSTALLMHKFMEGYDFTLPVNRPKIQSVHTNNTVSEIYKNISKSRGGLLNPAEIVQIPKASANICLKKAMQTQRVPKAVTTSEPHNPQDISLIRGERVNPVATAQKKPLPGLNDSGGVFAKKTDLTLRKLPSPQTTAAVENRETVKRESFVENYTQKANPGEHQKELTNHEISKMADSVYKIIEKRIAIEKDRRGWR